MRNALGLYFSYIHIHFKSGLQYKGWPFSIIQTLLVVVTDPISTILCFSKFGNIGSWTISHILLMYAMAVTCYGLAESFARGLDYFPFTMVRQGNFDRLLLRPGPLLVHSAASVFHIHRLSRVAGGFAAIGWALCSLGVTPSPLRVLLFVTAMCGGTLLYTGVFLMLAALSFFTIGAMNWGYIFTNGGYQVTRCPYEYAPRLLRTVFTFLVPIYIISYFPASAICGWGEPLWKGLLALPAGILFLIAAMGVWQLGINHYKSSGS